MKAENFVDSFCLDLLQDIANNFLAYFFDPESFFVICDGLLDSLANDMLKAPQNEVSEYGALNNRIAVAVNKKYANSCLGQAMWALLGSSDSTHAFQLHGRSNVACDYSRYSNIQRKVLVFGRIESEDMIAQSRAGSV